jgi:hypothetical protein
MNRRPVIAVIHATAASMSPVDQAFAEQFPGAELWHLLDDRLVTDAERAGGLTEPLHRRMATLIDYAVGAGADAVQLACSMYGPVAGAVTHPVPVITSDQAMFDEVARLAPDHVTVLASLAPSAKDSSERLGAALAEAGLEPRIDPVVVAEARAAPAAGNPEELGRVLAAAVTGLDDSDVVVLAQYSLAPAVAHIRAATGATVLSGPHLAATALASVLEAASR